MTLLPVLSIMTLVMQATAPVADTAFLRKEIANLSRQVAAEGRENFSLRAEARERERRIGEKLNSIEGGLTASSTAANRLSEQAREASRTAASQIGRVEDRLRFLVELTASTLILLVLAAVLSIARVTRRKHDRRDDIAEPIEPGMERRTEAPGLLPSPASSGQKLGPPSESPHTLPEVPDHALAIRVSEEIHRMRARFSQLPDSGVATKALGRSVDRIEESLNEAGYSITELAGKSYHDGMTIAAHFVADESLAADDRVIGRIIRPQINFRSVLIQPAEVEVRMGISPRSSESLTA